MVFGCAPARNGCSGVRSAAQLVHTRCGVPSWKRGGSSMRAALQGAQNTPPHSRQWCLVRRRDLNNAHGTSSITGENPGVSMGQHAHKGAVRDIN